MTYILLYIAGLIAAMVGVVWVIVARQPRAKSPVRSHSEGQDDWLFTESSLSDTQYSGLTSNSWHIDHRD